MFLQTKILQSWIDQQKEKGTSPDARAILNCISDKWPWLSKEQKAQIFQELPSQQGLDIQKNHCSHCGFTWKKTEH